MTTAKRTVYQKPLRATYAGTAANYLPATSVGFQVRGTITSGPKALLGRTIVIEIDHKSAGGVSEHAHQFYTRVARQ